MWTDTDAERVEAGRALGHDLFRYRRPHGTPAWPTEVREGFSEAAARRIATRMPDRFDRKWLQLRLNAFARGRAVDAGVTPTMLREIDVTHCPVTRKPLTHGECRDTDWSVDRLNNDGAYATNNLAVMSTSANHAKSARTFEQVMVLSAQRGPTDSLTPLEWLRLAGLMLGPCFANRHAPAPLLPLLAPIPPRAVQTATQLIQHALVTQAGRQADKNRLVKLLRTAASGESANYSLNALVDVVHQELKRVQHAGDVWLAPGTMLALARWKASLDARQWAAAGFIASGLVGARLIPRTRLLTWQLPAGGHVPAWSP